MSLQKKYRYIIALGNAGAKYAETFHNVGFWFADYLAVRNNFYFRNWKNTAEFAQIGSGADKEREGAGYIVKPLQLMNRSGLSARQFYDYHKLGIPPEQFLVIYDCIDLPIGTTRLREGIKNRSHNGLQSIFQQFQMNQVDAIQIGILPQELADCYQGKFDDLGVGRLEFYVLSRVGTQNKQKIVSSFREAEGLVL